MAGKTLKVLYDDGVNEAVEYPSSDVRLMRPSSARQSLIMDEPGPSDGAGTPKTKQLIADRAEVDDQAGKCTTEELSVTLYNAYTLLLNLRPLASRTE